MSFVTLQIPITVLFLTFLTYCPLPSIVDSGFSFIVWKLLFSSFLDRFSVSCRCFLRCLDQHAKFSLCKFLHSHGEFCFQFCITLLSFLISFEIPVAFQMPLSNDLRFSEKQKFLYPEGFLPWKLFMLFPATQDQACTPAESKHLYFGNSEDHLDKNFPTFLPTRHILPSTTQFFN